jgi:PTH1 family peptidyl-tRNA hydrolase
MSVNFEKFLIIGLGNPSYDKTVHNSGSLILGEHLKSIQLINKSNYSINKFMPNIFYYDGGKKENKYYMNETGIPIREIVKYNNIKYIFVIFDDIRVDYGKWKIIPEKIHRGHNGLKSIFQENPNVKIILISVGVGPKPPMMDLSTYVLSKISVENINKISHLVLDIFIYIYEEIKKIN